MQLTDPRFELMRSLEGGGACERLLVRRKDQPLPAVLQVLRPHLSKKPEASRAFQRLSGLFLELEHPRWAKAHDLGLLADGRPYLVVEHLDGESLASRLRRQGPSSPLALCEWLGPLALALEEAWARGVCHGNLQPGAVWLEPGGTARLTAFGLLVGGGEPARPSDDVRALGCLLYEASAGHFPLFAAGARAPELPASHAALAPLVHRCLAPDPAARFATAAEVGKALGALALTLQGAPQGATALGRAVGALPLGRTARTRTLPSGAVFGEASAHARTDGRHDRVETLHGGAAAASTGRRENARGSWRSEVQVAHVPPTRAPLTTGALHATALETGGRPRAAGAGVASVSSVQAKLSATTRHAGLATTGSSRGESIDARFANALTPRNELIAGGTMDARQPLVDTLHGGAVSTETPLHRWLAQPAQGQRAGLSDRGRAPLAGATNPAPRAHAISSGGAPAADTTWRYASKAPASSSAGTGAGPSPHSGEEGIWAETTLRYAGEPSSLAAAALLSQPWPEIADTAQLESLGHTHPSRWPESAGTPRLEPLGPAHPLPWPESASTPRLEPLGPAHPLPWPESASTPRLEPLNHTRQSPWPESASTPRLELLGDTREAEARRSAGPNTSEPEASDEWAETTLRYAGSPSVPAAMTLAAASLPLSTEEAKLSRHAQAPEYDQTLRFAQASLSSSVRELPSLAEPVELRSSSTEAPLDRTLRAQASLPSSVRERPTVAEPVELRSLSTEAPLDRTLRAQASLPSSVRERPTVAEPVELRSPSRKAPLLLTKVVEEPPDLAETLPSFDISEVPLSTSGAAPGLSEGLPSSESPGALRAYEAWFEADDWKDLRDIQNEGELFDGLHPVEDDDLSSMGVQLPVLDAAPPPRTGTQPAGKKPRSWRTLLGV